MTADNNNFEYMRKKIESLGPLELIKQVLEHYECPVSCGAACCKNLTIPITEPEARKIGKNSRVNRKILNTLVYPSGKYEMFKDREFREKYNGGFKVLPEKPCPFLNENNLCNIHKRKPTACVTYPINVLRKEAGDGYQFKINLCELGFNMYLDYVPFIYQVTVDNPKTTLSPEALEEVAANIRDNENFLIDNVENNKSNFENIGFMIVQDIELLKSFLMWLNLLGDQAAVEREKFREILKEQAKNRSVDNDEAGSI